MEELGSAPRPKHLAAGPPWGDGRSAPSALLTQGWACSISWQEERGTWGLTPHGHIALPLANQVDSGDLC